MSIPIFNHSTTPAGNGSDIVLVACPHCAADTTLTVPTEGEASAVPGCAHYKSFAYNPVGSGYECNFTDEA